MGFGSPGIIFVFHCSPGLSAGLEILGDSAAFFRPLQTRGGGRKTRAITFQTVGQACAAVGGRLHRGGVDGFLLHHVHPRSITSGDQNPNFDVAQREWDKVKIMNKRQLKEYIKRWVWK